MARIIHAEKVSKWYGQVLGVSEVDWSIDGGIVGLLGPNGAGKSTLMKMIVGLLQPSRGAIEVFGAPPFENAETRARIGYCPEHESTYEELSALELVTMMAQLSGVPRPRDAAAAALDDMGLGDVKQRIVGGFSKGMKQRAKLAGCLVHDPELLVLDEPLTGVDPVARAEIVEHIRALGAAGKTVIISSHVLYEIEALTEEIMLVYRGQVLAEGNVYGIRGLIDKRPHTIRIDCDRPRAIAGAVVSAEHIESVAFERDAVVVETADPDHCYDLLAQVSLEHEVTIRSMTSPDNNLGAVFEYLTGGGM